MLYDVSEMHAAFVVCTDNVVFDDLKADNLGSWKGMGTKKIYFPFLSSGSIRFTMGIPDST